MAQKLKTSGFVRKISHASGHFPIKSLFEVTIDIGNIPSRISDIMGSYEPNARSAEAWNNIMAGISYNISGGQLFILDIEKVALPEDKTSIDKQYHTASNTGGFIPGIISKGRSFASLGLTIRESQNDIVGQFFMAWARALSIEGFINFDLRANISVIEYGRDGEVRKIHRFTDAGPFNVSSGGNDMANIGEILTQNVDFAFSQYTISFL